MARAAHIAADGSRPEPPGDAGAGARVEPQGRERSEWLLAELSRPAAYPRPVTRVETRRTLLSLLFFTDERVYKLKQALDVGYASATSLARRRELCDEEVRLNAALAPGIHLGVVPIARGPDGHLVVGGAGEAVEWAVEMLRLPEDRMLSHLLEHGALDNALLGALVEVLTRFHRAAATGRGVDEHGTPAGIALSVEENFEQLAPFATPPGRVPRGALTTTQHAFLRTRARAFLTERRELLLRRVAQGRIREGHGDLHAENVCLLPRGFVLYDRIEFNRRFRCLDVASELAFLAMDLDQRGFPGFAAYLARRYAERAGDPELPALLGFYKGYRAIVRAKVALLATPAAAPEEREALRLGAMRYLQLALGYELGPALVLLAGLPASGKTTLAPHLARPLRAPAFHSDERRKRLAGIAAESSARADFGQGLYTSEARRRTYRSLLDDALKALTSGRSAVVDATFAERQFRAPFVDAATRLGVPYCFVHVHASEAVVRERMAARAGHGASDADLGTYLRARETFEPLDEVPGGHVLDVDSAAGAPEDQAALLFERLVALAT